MKYIVKNGAKFGIVDNDNYPYSVRVEFKPGDKWSITEGYNKIEGYKCVERDGIFIRLNDESVRTVFGDIEL